MPLPKPAETAADQIARIGRSIDTMTAAHITNGDPLPTPDQFTRSITTPVSTMVRASILDIDPDATDTDIARRTRAVLADLTSIYKAARRDAINRRRRVARTAPVDTEDDDRSSLFVLARRVGFAAAIATVVARGDKPKLDDVKKAGQLGGQPLPARLEARLRAEARTRTAVVRNEHAADVVESRTGWALYIRDALAGSDEPCVRVDRRWASPAWLRNHPVEHPNCTREGRPRELPPGARITLIR